MALVFLFGFQTRGEGPQIICHGSKPMISAAHHAHWSSGIAESSPQCTIGLRILQRRHEVLLDVGVCSIYTAAAMVHASTAATTSIRQSLHFETIVHHEVDECIRRHSFLSFTGG